MEIEQQIWGATSEGEAVVLYTLRNAAGAEVRLCNVGAAVVSILVPDRDGHLADVALGYKDFRSYFGDPALCGKSIGRVAGCIAYGTMRIDGEEYRLDINGMAGHLNGGVKGFAGRLWESRVETNRVVMSLSSDDGDQGYPGNLQVEAAFDFDEDNALEITYIARTDRTTPVNMACNLLLNLGGEGSGSVLDHELRLDASTVLEADDRLIPVSSSGQGKPGESHHLPESTEPIDGLLAIKSVRRKQRRRKFRPIDRIGIPLTDDGDPFVIPVAAARLRFGASAAQAIAGVERHAGLRRENLHPASRTCIAQFADFGQDILPPTVHGEEVVVPPQHPDPVEIGIDALAQAAQ